MKLVDLKLFKVIQEGSKKLESQKNKRRKIVIGIIIFICTLLTIYLGLSAYFMKHFYFGSVINGINVSGKSIEEVENKISSKIESYTLEIEERGNRSEKITANDINLKYNPNGKIKEFKDSQKPFKWCYEIFSKEKTILSKVVIYDEKLLDERINNLSCFDKDNIIEPKNANLEYTDNGYEIVKEVYGNKVNKDALYDNVVCAIINGKTKINLSWLNCYEAPKYTSESKEIAQAKEVLTKYTSSTITYTFGGRAEFLDKSTISSWLKIDDNCQVVFDEEKVRNYINTLGENYNTFGKSRDFLTSLGTTVKVNGGNYGWLINSSKEVNDLINTIKEGKAKTKEPIYTLTAKSREYNDIGNTYVEINLTKQHLWFYKEGSLIVQGDIVSGNVNNNCSTPTGTFRLNYKQKDATLKGQGYSSSVNFWMPFNGGIGIHDASWRYVFGGQIYKNNGSHGCVNAPYYLAKTIFENIEEDVPIICYSE